MGLPSTTRRALLGALPATAAAVTFPAAAMAATAADRREWEETLRAYDQVLAEDAAFTPGWLETWERCKAECDAIPHSRFDVRGYSGLVLATDDMHAVRQAQRDIAALDAGKMRLDPIPSITEYYDTKRQFVEAYEQRQRAVQAVRDRYGMDGADDEAEAFGDRIAELQTGLLKMPAPDLPALRWKLDNLREPDGDLIPWVAEVVEQLFADVARLLPEAK